MDIMGALKMTERKCSTCGRPFEYDPDTGLITYWQIKNGKPLCKECAIKIRGKCPVCGEVKGMCIHAQGF